METNILTPRELFQKDIRYMIPPFQRPYVWNQDEQWEPLWNDVRNLAEDYLEASETGGDISALEQTRRHFLGAVVISSGVPKDLTMEHLMPQRWQGSWSPPDAEDQEAAEYERGKLIHSIGNLTLTTHSLNSSMSNAPWEDKRSELQKHSILLLNSALTNRPCWNEDSIRARSRQMAEWLSEYWPGPDSPDWES